MLQQEVCLCEYLCGMLIGLLYAGIEWNSWATEQFYLCLWRDHRTGFQGSHISLFLQNFEKRDQALEIGRHWDTGKG